MVDSDLWQTINFAEQRLVPEVGCPRPHASAPAPALGKSQRRFRARPRAERVLPRAMMRA